MKKLSALFMAMAFVFSSACVTWAADTGTVSPKDPKQVTVKKQHPAKKHAGTKKPKQKKKIAADAKTDVKTDVKTTSKTVKD